MFDNVLSDLRRKIQVCGTGRSGAGKVIILLQPGTVAAITYRLGNWASKIKLPFLKHPMMLLYHLLNCPVSILTGVRIMHHTEIGRGFVVRNFSGIFVGAKKIGENCTINPGVTIGNIKGRGRDRVIGDNVYFGPGAKVLGDVTVGANVYIYANSVVLSSVPDNCSVMGVPARIFLKDEEVRGRPLQGQK